MPAYLVVVRPRIPQAAKTHPLIAAARSLHLEVESVAEERRYLLDGALDDRALAQLAAELLVDPVEKIAEARPLDEWSGEVHESSMDWAIDVAYRPGVTDNEGDSILTGAERAGIGPLAGARTVRRTLI